ncbi:unnamed protein product, partial [marine sediment metagenome]
YLIQITSLETVGNLYLDNNSNGIIDTDEDITLNQDIGVASIPNLKFKPLADETGINYDNFNFKVHDGTVYSEGDYTMTINVNNIPTDISLSSSSIDENEVTGSIVGTFTTIDENIGDTFTYTFATGDGMNDADNARFFIDGYTLKTSVAFNYEIKSSYNIYIQTNDGNGGTFKEAFIISVTDANDFPTDIALSTTSVSENQPLGSTVGVFSSTDEDDGDTHTYSLVTGNGTNDLDNASFSISGNDLISIINLDYETKPFYQINIQTNDGNGGTYVKAFVIVVININDNAPVLEDNTFAIDENRSNGTS